MAERGEEEADDEEDEDEEEIVVFGGCGLRRHAGGGSFAGCSGLRCRYRREDGGHLFRLQVAGGWLEGPGRDLAACWADLVGGGARGRRGAVIFAFCVRPGWAPAMWEGLRVSVRGRKQFAWATFVCEGAWVWGCWAVCGGLVWVTGRDGRAVWRGAPRGRCVWDGRCGGRRGSLGGAVCGGRVWACWRGGRPVSRGPGLCASVGACGPLGGEWRGRGRGCGAGFACGLSVYVFACRGAFVWSRVRREVWTRSLPSFAATVRILQMHVPIWYTSWSVVG